MEFLIIGLGIGLLIGTITTKYFEGRYLETKGDDEAINYTPVCIRQRFYYIVPEESYNELKRALRIARTE